jgi:hypothetical protein
MTGDAVGASGVTAEPSTTEPRGGGIWRIAAFDP